VIIVEKPLGRRRDAAASSDGIGDQTIRLVKQRGIRGKTAEQAIGTAAAADLNLMPARQVPGVTI